MYAVRRHDKLAVQGELCRFRRSFSAFFLLGNICCADGRFLFGGQQVRISPLQFPVPRGIFRIGCVDCYQNAFAVCSALEDQLMVCDDYIPVDSVAESVAGSADCDEFPDKILIL